MRSLHEGENGQHVRKCKWRTYFSDRRCFCTDV